MLGSTVNLRSYMTAVGVLLGAVGCGGGGDEHVAIDAAPAVPGAPADVVAADGETDEFVVVQWTRRDDADAYRVYRDGALITETTLRAFDDEGAGFGGPPLAPADLTVTPGFSQLFGQVTFEVHWLAAVVPAGPVHDYEVRAVSGGGEGAGNVDTGYRGPSGLLGHTYRVDGDDFSAVTGAAPTLTNMVPLPDPYYVLGPVAASQGTSADHVELSFSATTRTLTRRYQVRGHNARGDGAVASAEATWAGDPVHYWWFRSSGDADLDYAPLGVGGPTYLDTTAPADGSARYYKCRALANPGPPIWSAPVRGFRAVP
jgi:hypothetical protein